MAAKGMIQPFVPNLVRQIEVDALPVPRPVISYGLSSYGYDIRLSPSEFRIFRHIPGTVVDPKRFNPKNLELTPLQTDDDGDHFILPAHSYGLGVALEKLQVPHNISVICIGKSTYARCFRGDTAVALVDGTAPTLEEMAHRAESGERFWGYSIDRQGEVIVSLLEHPRYIGRDTLLKITLDNTQSIFCTPDHLFMTREGRMTPAHQLRPHDSLMPLYRHFARGHERVYQPLNGYLSSTHYLSDEWNLRHGVYDTMNGIYRRHLDHNCFNNNPWNITRRNLAQLGLAPQEIGFGNGSRPKQHNVSINTSIQATLAKWEQDFERADGWPQNQAEQVLAPSGLGRALAVKSISSHAVRNHQVVSVKEIPGVHDVYCLTVPEAGNFALEAGVFVHNCGIIANLTPAEAGWRGHLTLEFSNSSSADCRIYANEGVVQLLFLEGEPCEVSYETRQGKYQDQPESVTLARV